MSNSIEEEIVRQSRDMGEDNFICKTCKHYKGGCKCQQGVFIAFVNANISGCVYHERGRKCPHCGRNI